MRTSPVVVEKFTGMRYLSAHEETIEDAELMDASNVIVTEQGAIERRKGFDSVVTLTGPNINAWILGRHHTSIKDSILIGHAGGLVLANANGSAIDWNDTTFVNVQATVQYDNQSFVFSYQTQQILRLDAAGNRTSNWADVKASLAIAHKGRIFCCNNRFIPSDTLRYSQVYTDPTNPNFSGAGAWPAANTISVNPGDGESIIALAEYNDSIIIFKETSTWILYTDGSPTTGWQLKKLSEAIGCVGSFTPRVIGSLLYFLSSDGVYRTDGTTFEEISRPIKNAFASMSHTNILTMYRRTGAEWDGLYIVQPDWSDDEWYVFNTANDTWTRWVTPVNLSNPVSFPEEPAKPLRAMLWQGSGTSCTLWETTYLSSYQDGEGGLLEPIDSDITFKRFDFGQPDQWKYIPSINVTFERRVASPSEVTQLVQASIYIDGSLTPVTRNLNLPITDDKWNFVYQFQGPGRCRLLQLRLSTEAISDLAVTKITYQLIKAGHVGKSS